MGTWTCSESNGSIWIGWCIFFVPSILMTCTLRWHHCMPHTSWDSALLTVQPVHLIGLGVFLAASKKTKPQAQVPFAIMTGEASKWWDLWLWASPLCNSAFLTRHLASDTGASKDDVGLKGPWTFPNNFDFRQGWTVERTNVDTKTWHDVAPQEIEFVGGPKLAPFAHRIFPQFQGHRVWREERLVLACSTMAWCTATISIYGRCGAFQPDISSLPKYFSKIRETVQ